MGAIFKCDLCGITDPNVSTDEDFCDSCDSRLLEIKSRASNEAFERLEKRFGSLVANQDKVVRLLEWVREKSADEFKRSYGTQGEALLDLVTK